MSLLSIFSNKKRFRKRLIIKIAGLIAGIFVIAFFVWFMSGEGVKTNQNINWGVTFSPRQTDFLGIDAGQTFAAILDELEIKNLRLQAPWNEVERQEGVYDFSSIDWMIEEAGKRDAKVILAVGRKLFRWPECHDPSWAFALDKKEFENKVLNLLTAEIQHFKQYDNIVGWQVENEALLPFGQCDPKPNWDLFKKEIALVRSLDSRPALSTESGELSNWLKIGSQTDWLGGRLYRVTNNPFLGKIYYPFRPGFYQKKAALAKALNKNLEKVFISELQLEPWGEKSLAAMTLPEPFAGMSLQPARCSIAFAQATGLPDIYIWGLEWWYWLKVKHNDSRFWDLGKEIFIHRPRPVE